MYNFTPQRCTSTKKIMYKTRDQAQNAVRDSYIERGVQLWVYVCDYCGTWHLTSRSPVQDAIRNVGRTSAPTGRKSWSGKPILSRKRGFKPRKH